ncbi:hypothetical protein ACRE_075590 [Hapsidospora chrysogenum ATCC 11550]|uniref:Uncharacterized protein n=1 Tax=Hapsidospora chrysogenum (strain ATCC 11550 / CBS 779.69 / DSM 880 / IAM 14645 / JCM 23072 / IMI 49137) TaxID=857340 RepID=A0A086SX88_HAPC1|nr:hypothetical protein ACRE_075590 [Hapsidospora chrysogenum ATCC 11550]
MSATAHPAKYPKFLPALAVAGTVAAVTAYITSQLSLYRNVMDSRFAQATSPESEAKRRKTFEGTNSDPRESIYNRLGR